MQKQLYKKLIMLVVYIYLCFFIYKNDNARAAKLTAS